MISWRFKHSKAIKRTHLEDGQPCHLVLVATATLRLKPGNMMSIKETGLFLCVVIVETLQCEEPDIEVLMIPLC